uniref:Uncharacterized protein n=1 Tax=Oryza punctata TaxID=4537 RepID=A0A0E0JKP7_ORYPU
MDDKGWVISVDLRSKTLQSVAELDERKNSFFKRYYNTSEISKYLVNATEEVSALCREGKRLRKQNKARRTRITQCHLPLHWFAAVVVVDLSLLRSGGRGLAAAPETTMIFVAENATTPDGGEGDYLSPPILFNMVSERVT